MQNTISYFNSLYSETYDSAVVFLYEYTKLDFKLSFWKITGL